MYSHQHYVDKRGPLTVGFTLTSDKRVPEALRDDATDIGRFYWICVGKATYPNPKESLARAPRSSPTDDENAPSSSTAGARGATRATAHEPRGPTIPFCTSSHPPLSFTFLLSRRQRSPFFPFLSLLLSLLLRTRRQRCGDLDRGADGQIAAAGAGGGAWGHLLRCGGGGRGSATGSKESVRPTRGGHSEGRGRRARRRRRRVIWSGRFESSECHMLLSMNWRIVMKASSADLKSENFGMFVVRLLQGGAVVARQSDQLRRDVRRAAQGGPRSVPREFDVGELSGERQVLGHGHCGYMGVSFEKWFDCRRFDCIWC